MWGPRIVVDGVHERLSAQPESAWVKDAVYPTFAALQEHLEVEFVVVGGGITGVTTAYLLAQAGARVALLEASRLLYGATGHTTAKVTAQHSLIYDELIQHMGVERARQYYEANAKALQFVRETVAKHQITCQFEDQDAYVYATTEAYERKVEQEWRAYQRLSIPGEIVDRIPFSLPVQNALVMKHQAQFHPLQYLAQLVQSFTDKGGQVFEGTVAVGIEEGPRPTVVTRDGYRVTAKKVLVCTHFPFYDGAGFYFARMHAQRGYIVAARTLTAYPGGMYISADNPSRSLRSTKMDGETLTLISGEAHPTGQGENTLAHYAALEAFGREVLGLREVLYRWSNQDLFTLDSVPYIGQIGGMHANVLVATGYMKWGMTTGTAAGLLLRDLALEQSNPYADLYAPERFYIDPSLKHFLGQNLGVAAHLIKGKFEAPDRSVDSLAPGEGAVVHFRGRRAGAYKDVDGTVSIVDTTCTHMYCEVAWNDGDRTWDCPCHGSRFSTTGDVIEGPANLPLQKLQ